MDKIRQQPFSINNDESTTNSNKCVLGILVNYCSEKEKKIVCEHLVALELITENTNTLFDACDSLFRRFFIPREASF